MKQLVDKRFETDADLKQSVTSWLQTLDTDFLCAGMQTYVSAMLNPLTPELNPSAQRYLPRFFTGDFAS
jgi:hypothetical protein